MAGVIYKYAIPGPGSGPVRMPKGAHCLCAREQGNEAFVWAIVDPSAELEARHFVAIETGKTNVPDGSRYLGTAILFGGEYVLHIFEPATEA